MTTIAAMAIIATSGVIFGMTGFGFALVSVPPLLLLYPPDTVVTVTLSVGLLTSVMVVIEAWRELQARTVLSLLPGAVAGLLVGVRVLTGVDPAWLKAGTGVIVTFYALLVLRGIEPRGLGNRWAPAAAGFASGVLTTSTGLSGPPIIMLFSARRLAVRAFRSSISAYFVFTNLTGLLVLGGGQAIDRDDLVITAILVPAALLGTLAGSRLVRLLNPARFRRLTLIVLLATGLSAVGTVLAALL